MRYPVVRGTGGGKLTLLKTEFSEKLPDAGVHPTAYAACLGHEREDLLRRLCSLWWQELSSHHLVSRFTIAAPEAPTTFCQIFGSIRIRQLPLVPWTAFGPKCSHHYRGVDYYNSRRAEFTPQQPTASERISVDYFEQTICVLLLS